MQMLTMQSCVRTTLKNTAESFGDYESYMRVTHSARNSDVFAALDDCETASERDEDSRVHGPCVDASGTMREGTHVEKEAGRVPGTSHSSVDMTSAPRSPSS